MAAPADLVALTSQGLYCPRGDFYIDPWQPVSRAVITHAHADHARAGSERYDCAQPGEGLLRMRIGEAAVIAPHPYNAPFAIGDARVSLHPAGHVLGSSQVRVEVDGHVCVVSGDYKRDPDPTCAPFEPVPCDTLITEATFGLPIYRWEPTERVIRAVLEWWDACVARKRTALLLCYALGKAQRVLAELHRAAPDRVAYLHGALEEPVRVYREAGVAMLATERVTDAKKGASFAGKLVIAPPSAHATAWVKRLGDFEAGFASGWMRVRGVRRRKALDRGFAISDHADWPSLLRTVNESGAKRVLVTHGFGDPLVRVLREQGRDADALRTQFEGEHEA